MQPSEFRVCGAEANPESTTCHLSEQGQTLSHSALCFLIHQRYIVDKYYLTAMPWELP